MLPDYILAIKMSCPIPPQNSRLNQRLPQGRKCHRSSSLEVHEGAGEECRQSIFPSCRCSSSAQECFGRGASLTSGHLDNVVIRTHKNDNFCQQGISPVHPGLQLSYWGHPEKWECPGHQKMTYSDNGPGPGRNYRETAVFTFS